MKNLAVYILLITISFAFILALGFVEHIYELRYGSEIFIDVGFPYDFQYEQMGLEIHGFRIKEFFYNWIIYFGFVFLFWRFVKWRFFKSSDEKQ